MSAPRPRVLLAFPVFTHVFPRAFERFLQMVAHVTRCCPQYDFDVQVIERQLLHGAMNAFAATVKGSPEHEVLVAFDDDCIPPFHTVRRLLEHIAAGKDIVAAVGVTRGFPFTTTVGRYFPGKRATMVPNASGFDIRGFYWLDDIASEPVGPDGLIKVDFCGFPVVAIHRRVLEAIDGDPFQTREVTGGTTHDVFFCNRAAEKGFSVYVDPALSCGHIVEAPIVTLENRKLGRDAHQAATAAKES